MTKIYEIMPIVNEDAIKAFQGFSEFKSEAFDEYAKFLNLAYSQNENKFKFINNEFYELFIKTDESVSTANFYEEFKNLSLEKIPYSEYIFSFFDSKIYFAVKKQNSKEPTIYSSNKYFIVTTTDHEFSGFCDAIKMDLDEGVNYFCRQTPTYDYKVAFNKNIFIILDEYAQIELNSLNESPNLLKILLVQLLVFGYKTINNSFETKLNDEFDNISVSEILDLKKKFFNHKITSKYKAKEDYKEAFTIFEMAKKYNNLEEEYSEISKNLNEFFTIKNEELKIQKEKEKILKLENKEKEQAKCEEERQNSNKFKTRLTIIAIFIAILTFANVIVAIFNILDK